MRCSVKQQENVQFYAFQPAFNFNHHCLECLSLTHFGLHLTNIHDTQQFCSPMYVLSWYRVPAEVFLRLPSWGWSSRCAGLGANPTLYMGQRPPYKEEIEAICTKLAHSPFPIPPPPYCPHVGDVEISLQKSRITFSRVQQSQTF